MMDRGRVIEQMVIHLNYRGKPGRGVMAISGPWEKLV